MRKIAVLGLGYVGLSAARAFARVFRGTVGFDRDDARIRDLARGVDPTGALAEAGGELGELRLSADPADLAACDFFVIAVPTSIDAAGAPDLTQLADAARTVACALKRGDVVVVESTVAPGTTEGFVGPLLERSGLQRGVDFTLGYSPERINPGDPEHRFERVRKVIAAEDERGLRLLEGCYGAVVEAGLYRAPSIQVAEAAKLFENVQRDMNIALANELALTCERAGLETADVLATAASKWNFLPFRPGLVGGHCLGVAARSFAARARELGVEARVTLAARELNERMAELVAARIQRSLEALRGRAAGARLALLGLAFKPGVADPRSSRVPELARRLRAAGCEVLVHDPLVDAGLAARSAGIELVSRGELAGLDAVVLAVAQPGLPALAIELARGGVRLLVDLPGAVALDAIPPGVAAWRL